VGNVGRSQASSAQYTCGRRCKTAAALDRSREADVRWLKTAGIVAEPATSARRLQPQSQSTAQCPDRLRRPPSSAGPTKISLRRTRRLRSERRMMALLESSVAHGPCRPLVARRGGFYHCPRCWNRFVRLFVLVVFYCRPSSCLRGGGLTLAFQAGLALDVITAGLGQHAIAPTMMAAWRRTRLRLRVFRCFGNA